MNDFRKNFSFRRFCEKLQKKNVKKCTNVRPTPLFFSTKKTKPKKKKNKDLYLPDLTSSSISYIYVCMYIFIYTVFTIIIK